MKTICPLCNGLYRIKINCYKCNSPMEDKGPLVNLMDNYSPYLLDDISHPIDGVEKDECIHIFECPICGVKETYSIERKII